MLKFLLPQMVLDVVSFTVTPTAAAKTITLDGFTAPCAGIVDWGDGAVSPLASTAAISHTYANTAARKIVIRGTLGGVWNTTSSVGKNLVTSVDDITSNSLLTLQNTFRGCTALRTLPADFDVPNVGNFANTFYQNRSITSNLPNLWVRYNAKAHGGCFTDCCKSLYGQHGSGCSFRQLVPAVAGQTYFQKYGTGCPSAGYVAAVPDESYWKKYRNSCPHLGPEQLMYSQWSPHIMSCYINKYNVTDWHSCSHANAKISSSHTTSVGWVIGNAGPSSCTCGRPSVTRGEIIYSGSIPDGKKHCPEYNWGGGICEIIYKYGNSAYYTCNASAQSTTGTCNGNCKRVYQSGQSAYYKCTKSNATCKDALCPYPYANEVSYNAARAKGWA